MIDSIIFDVGNVLAGFDWVSYLNRQPFDEKTKKILASAVFSHPDWVELDRGILSNEEIIRRFIRNAGGFEKEIRSMAATFGETVTLRSYAMDWIKDMKARGFSLYVLSNYGDLVYQTSSGQLPFLELMDGVFFSWQHQLIKPAPAFYQKLLDTFRIQPEQAVFLDDRQENLEGAASLGIHTILFQKYEQASQDLEDLLHMTI